MILTPERFIWATELLNVKPTDNVLEIGCGAGILAELIADRLETGSLMAIDKSIPMIEKAKKRNQKHLNRQVSTFIAADFLKSKIPSLHFDSIVAFNVNFFWKDPAKELLIIKQALKKDGLLYVFYQAPFEITISHANPIMERLVSNHWDICDIKLKKLVPTSAFCIGSKPKGQ